ncbi:unnamed protein product [Withania somnifera]
MMIGERNRRHPTVDVPPWPPYSDYDQTVNNMQFMLSPNNNNTTTICEGYFDVDELNDNDEFDELLPVDVYACDDFRMYEFKIRRCGRGRSHDWTECPFVHLGEKARRRDPRKYNYSGTACPDFRKGSCSRGDACEFAHGVFECWLHPLRYRTQPCKDGGNCKRRVCFFAHSPEQLRVLTHMDNNLPKRCVKTLHFVSSPESSSPPTESPPMSPMTVHSVNSLSRSPTNDVMASLRRLQISRLNSMPTNIQIGSPVFGSPRRALTRPGYFSLPATPSGGEPTRSGIRCFELWENGECEEEPVMERVESGRDLRVKMFEKLSKENQLDLVDPDPNLNLGHNPDVEWSLGSYPVVKRRDFVFRAS